MSQDDIAVRVKGISKVYQLRGSTHDQLIFFLKRLIAFLLPFKWLKLKKPISTHENFYALNDVSFDIRKGESWGFIGVNGSGKSTLLKIISGNLRPSAGHVEVDGKVVILNYGSGFNGDFTGKENIYMKATLMGLTKKQINDRYQSIVDFAELGDFINQPVKTYSSGMVSRLGFAIIAHVDADIIISDEALAVGDVFFVQKCMGFIRDFLKKNTFLFVTHSTNDILSLCQHTVWLERGKIKALGSPAKVTRAYADKAHLDTVNSNQDNTNAPLIATETLMKSEVVADQFQLSQSMNYIFPTMSKDLRWQDINQTHLRNDIQILSNPLNPDSGVGGATILSVTLSDEAGETLSWVVGGEKVTLNIEILAEQDLLSPIAGFQVLDNLGQVLFADNSNFIIQNQPVIIKENTILAAEFTYQMPVLPVGEYLIRAAIATGESEGNAVLLQTIDEALTLRSIQSYVKQGLIGVPMHSIQLSCEEEKVSILN